MTSESGRELKSPARVTDDLGAVISQAHGHGECGAAFDAFGEQMIHVRDERVPREQRHPVSAALVVEEGAEDGMHPGELAQHGRLIDATRTLHHAVHFLQRNHVRLQLAEIRAIRSRSITPSIPSPCLML